jgi:DNA-directed RNA polymerase specialized sigma24 family protein
MPHTARRSQHDPNHASRKRLRDVGKRFDTAVLAFTTAETERLQAVHDAHHTGLSIRTIAEILGISSTRVHQLLQQEK